MNKELRDKMRLEIGARIASALDDKGWKAADLCARVGMRQSQLSKIINGTAGLTVERLIGIVHALDVPYERILGGAEPAITKRQRTRRDVVAELVAAIVKGDFDAVMILVPEWGRIIETEE